MKSKFKKIGEEIRRQTRELILAFMKQSEDCQPGAEGIRQAELFVVWIGASNLLLHQLSKIFGLLDC